MALAKLLSSMYSPGCRADHGKLAVMGFDVTAQYREAQRALGVVPQELVFDPFLYMIDGFRYGFFGVSDVAPDLSMVIVAGCFLALSLFTLWLLKIGYKLRY